MEPTPWPGVLRRGRELYTANAEPGQRVYGEDLVADGGVEYRRWDPFRSKLAAYLLRAPPAPLWPERGAILYLGGAHGTTVSHLSDALPDSAIFVIEKSPVSFAQLLSLARRRRNLLPLLADAQLPERYLADVGRVDFVYQDVAQRGQARIFEENASLMLAPSGRALLMLKVRSVSQSRPAREVSNDATRLLTGKSWKVRPGVDLTPFSREHLGLVVTR